VQGINFLTCAYFLDDLKEELLNWCTSWCFCQEVFQ